MQTAEQNQTAEQRGSIGRLMSPLEVYAATLSRSDLPRNIKFNWFLCGDVSERFWDALMERPDAVGFRITAFTTPVHTGYVCFALQIDRTQVRFLLLLGSEKVGWFLKDASLSGVHLSIARNNSSKAIVRTFGAEPALIAPLLDVANKCHELTGDALINDFALAVSAVYEASTMGSALQGVVVEDVQVIVVSPE